MGRLGSMTLLPPAFLRGSQPNLLCENDGKWWEYIEFSHLENKIYGMQQNFRNSHIGWIAPLCFSQISQRGTDPPFPREKLPGVQYSVQQKPNMLSLAVDDSQTPCWCRRRLDPHRISPCTWGRPPAGHPSCPHSGQLRTRLHQSMTQTATEGSQSYPSCPQFQSVRHSTAPKYNPNSNRRNSVIQVVPHFNQLDTVVNLSMTLTGTERSRSYRSYPRYPSFQ